MAEPQPRTFSSTLDGCPVTLHGYVDADGFHVEAVTVNVRDVDGTALVHDLLDCLKPDYVRMLEERINDQLQWE